MRAGSAREKITLRTVVETIDANGDLVPQETVLGPAWAEFRAFPKEERFNVGSERKVSTERGRFYIRKDQRIYAEEGGDEGTKIQVVHRGKVWDVLAISPTGVRTLELIAEVRA